MTERDPLGKDAHEPGSKLDAGKAQIVRYVLKYFPRAIQAVARVSEYGATKYTEMGWATVPDGYTRYTEALGRHLLADPLELDVSGLDHDAQIAWNALARLEIKLRDKDNVRSIADITDTGTINLPGPYITVAGL